jgi:uncharacterized protein (DUF4415 family)
VNKENLKIETSKIDWAAVESAPLADSPDEDSPELTTTEISQLRLLTEILPELVFEKQRVPIMLDTAIVQAYKIKAAGRDYQTLINETLHRALETENLKEALREVIREELHLA